MENNIREIVEELSREVIAGHGINPEEVNLPPDVKRWVELIHEHLTDEHLTINWLINKGGGSISGRFKWAIKVYPKKYISVLRLELAKVLLKSDGIGVLEVALAVGYKDSSGFCKAFAKHTGINPKEFKNSLHNSIDNS